MMEMRKNSNSIILRLKQWSRIVKRDVAALYFAARDPGVPWYAKAVAVAVVAYALSPIDLIPDFIPVLGYLDDIIIVPLGILLVVNLIPASVMADLRARAEKGEIDSSSGLIAAAVVILIWIAVTVIAVIWIAQS